MVKLRKIIIKGSQDRQILCDLSTHEQCDRLVIFCHGYKGYKDWGAWQLVANHFANRNIAFLKFNFSHNGGTLDNPIDFSDLEAFGQNNYSLELDDLNLVIQYVLNEFDQDTVLKKGLHLIGHSRGGGIAILGAFENQVVKSLTTWAAVSDFKSRFPNGSELNKWQEDRVRFVKNGRTKQDMPHYYQFYEDFVKHEERLTISRAAAQLKQPFLIIHGTQDEAVNMHEAMMLNTWAQNSNMSLVSEGNHTFGSKHPWTDDHLPADLEQVCDETIAFISDL